MSKLGITMPSLNQPITEYPKLARAAEDAGLDSVWFPEFYRNPFVVLAACAQATERVQLGTALAATTGRSPFEMANAAADVDEFSNGRMLLTIGAGGPGFADFFHGNDISRPVARVREYTAAMRDIWRHLADDEPLDHQGEFYRSQQPPLNPFGGRPIHRNRIPVYTAAARPRALQLAGEISDGLLAYLMTPDYIDQVVLPNVQKGAAKAGRDPKEVDIASLVLCSVSEDREAAMRLARINVGMYVADPLGEPMVEFMGLTEERAALQHTLITKGVPALEGMVSDELVRTFAIAGTPDECAEQLTGFTDTLSHVVLHIPYVPPATREDSLGAFHGALRALGPATRG